MGNYFTREEAAAKVGRRIRSVRTRDGVPGGTRGMVTQARRVTPSSAAVEIFDVEIDLYPPKRGNGQAVVGSKRATFHHVRKDEYESFLAEEAEEP